MALAFMVAAEQDIVFPSATEIRGAYYLPNANIDFEGLTVRLITNEVVNFDFGDAVKFNFPREELFLFSKSSGERIL